MKIYKKIIKAFGGAGLYMDKTMLSHLNVSTGDEVVIELKDGCIELRKPDLDLNKIQELLNAEVERRNQHKT